MGDRYDTDIELGQRNGSRVDASTLTPRNGARRTRLKRGIQRLWSFIMFSFPKRDPASIARAGELDKIIQIEDQPNGYPRFAALMASHELFHVARRFSKLRLRLLLDQQDKLSVLESTLERIDREEQCPLFLGCRRQDRNQERAMIMEKIEAQLKAYDELLERTQKTTQYERPHSQYIRSLQRWLEVNGCIHKAETRFLWNDEDLLALAPHSDQIVSWLEEFVSRRLAQLRGKKASDQSRDPGLHIFPRLWTTRGARALLTPVIVLLLLCPIIVCYNINSLTAKLSVIVSATSIFVMALSTLTKSKTLELAVGGATYSAVLVVFITNSD